MYHTLSCQDFHPHSRRLGTKWTFYDVLPAEAAMFTAIPATFIATSA